MLDNLNVEFEEMDMQELQEENGGRVSCKCLPTVLPILISKK